MKKMVVSIFLLLTVLPISANETLSFRDIKMGMTQQEVKENASYGIDNCIKKCCYSREKVKNIIIDVAYCFAEDKDFLDHIFMYFKPEDYEDLKEALFEKFGKPSNVVEQKVQNRMGATFKNESSFWNFKRGDRVAISRYGSSLDNGLIVFSSREYNNAQEQKSKKAKAAPGF